MSYFRLLLKRTFYVYSPNRPSRPWSLQTGGMLYHPDNYRESYFREMRFKNV